jgi:hypothetical protein
MLLTGRGSYSPALKRSVKRRGTIGSVTLLSWSVVGLAQRLSQLYIIV